MEEDVPAEGPPAATKEENAQRPTPNVQRPITEAPQPSTKASPARTNAQPSTKETPVDDSIRALTGPPSALRSNQTAETNPPIDTSTPATAAAAPSAAGAPKLTAVNAMDIADIEARTRGYDLGDYELPKADYNSANDTWSVGYAPRGADTKALNVTNQDKNGKAEIKK